MNRRCFLQVATGAGVATMARSAVGEAAAPGEHVRLGFDTYSIRGLRWKAPQVLNYAAGLKLDVLQITHGDFESVEEPYLKKIKDQADRLGIAIEPGFGCICPQSKGWNPKQGDPSEYLRRGILAAKTLGSRSFKVFMGNSADRAGWAPIPAMMEAAIKILKSVRSQALDAGVMIAVENHGDMQAREAKTLIEETGKDFVGICLDTGNPVMLMEDPLMALEVLGPYVVTSHFRDAVVYETPRGAAAQWVALGDGVIDFKRFVRRFAELCPKTPFQLEIITGSPPRELPYLEADFWKAFPNMPASDFAPFLALAKNGHPFMGSMLIAGAGKQPPEYQAALIQQQRVDLERSLDYAKNTLGVGVRWRA